MHNLEFLPDEVVYQDVRHPEVLDDVRVDVDLPPGPVCAVVEDHPVLRPPHVVAQPQADLLQDKTGHYFQNSWLHLYLIICI